MAERLRDILAPEALQALPLTLRDAIAVAPGDSFVHRVVESHPYRTAQYHARDAVKPVSKMVPRGAVPRRGAPGEAG